MPRNNAASQLRPVAAAEIMSQNVCLPSVVSLGSLSGQQEVTKTLPFPRTPDIRSLCTSMACSVRHSQSQLANLPVQQSGNHVQNKNCVSVSTWTFCCTFSMEINKIYIPLQSSLTYVTISQQLEVCNTF